MNDRDSSHNNFDLDVSVETAPPGRAHANLDPAKMMFLLNASKAFASTTDLEQLLTTVMSEVRSVLGCEGAGVLVHDKDKDDFYWRSVQDPGSFLSSVREEIRIPKGQGICGWVLATGKPALVHDAPNDPRFYRLVEDKSGYPVRNLVCVPLRMGDKKLGVLYALNKLDNSFTDEDVEILMALAGNVALALENASYYERLVNSHKELERLNRVKDKILNHLSHELKTPLAVIEASLFIMERRLKAAGVPPETLPFERINRNLNRLKTIEKQVGHIVEDKDYHERKTILSFLEHLDDFIEIQGEEEPVLREALEALRRRIYETFPTELQGVEKVSVEETFRSAESLVHQMTQDRILDVAFISPDPAVVRIQPLILKSVLNGLVRNAIENTPDHGRITVKGRISPQGYTITVRDYGVGIPESEQPNVFEGFYPIQETDMYSSGRRYAFNAGGTGTDLLKMKIFAQRFGFHIRFTSQRCSCIPTSRDTCSGDITNCKFCETEKDCLNNGGTEFVIEIPSELVETSGEE
jgi:signal transduction histidine kinase